MRSVERLRGLAAVGAAVWAAWFTGATAIAEPIAERIAALRPPAERWQQVGWRTDLDAARREAARLRRPLFIWAMNGNPLGCT